MQRDKAHLLFVPASHTTEDRCLLLVVVELSISCSVPTQAFRALGSVRTDKLICCDAGIQGVLTCRTWPHLLPRLLLSSIGVQEVHSECQTSTSLRSIIGSIISPGLPAMSKFFCVFQDLTDGHLICKAWRRFQTAVACRNYQGRLSLAGSKDSERVGHEATVRPRVT